MRNLHLVSHTHWDREWYLTFQQFRLKLVHLIDHLLDILAADPDYKYFMLDGQTILLEDYLAVRPEREAILRQFIQSGRITIGPWYVLPDEFLVSPEATIRNLLLGDQTCRRYGPKMHVGYSPDQFGHIGQMPQILRGFNIHTASLWRGQPQEACELWWEAPDGSRVFTANLRDGYGYASNLPVDKPESFTLEIRHLRDQHLPYAAAPHLLLMNGNDHMEPSANTPRAIASTRGLLDGDELIHSTLVNYLTATQAAMEGKSLPVVKGEMRDCKRQHLLPGVLSTRMWIKQRNFACETLLEKWTEPFSTFAYWIPAERRSPIFQQKSDIVRAAWRLLLQNHPHDSICGCSIDQVHREMQVRFDQVDQIGEEVTRESLESLAASIRTESDDPSEPGLAIVVFNPSSHLRTDVSTAILEIPASSSGTFELVDETGAALPFETRGLGSREIINTTLNPKEFQAMFGQVIEGRAAGMTVQDLTIRREGSQVYILAVMEVGGEPNLLKWNQGVKEIQTCLVDPGLSTFNIKARTGSSTRLVFAAPRVPALGYRTFWLRDKPGHSQPVRLNAAVRILMPLGTRLATSPLGARLVGFLSRRGSPGPANQIENEFFTVEAKKDGTVSVLDKRTGVIYSGLNRFIDGGDRGDEYNYCPPEGDRLVTARLRHVRSQHGPVQQLLELSLDLKIPVELTPDRSGRLHRTILTPITTRITLTNGLPRLDIETEVENSARDHRLRVHFPAPFAADSGYHDGHFEIVRRPIGVPAFDETWIEHPRPEVPERAFTQVVGDRLGLTVANRGLPEVEVLSNAQGNGEIALTLLRCVGWLSRDDFATRKGHAGPKLATPEAQMPGSWTFEYAILPHAAAAEDVIPLTYAFQAPLRAVGSTRHPGSFPGTASFVATKPADFCISAVKEAEDGRGWLVRGYNLSDAGIQVELKPWRLFRHVERINLAEEKQADLAISTEGSVLFPAKGHEIVSVLFRD